MDARTRRFIVEQLAASRAETRRYFDSQFRSLDKNFGLHLDSIDGKIDAKFEERRIARAAETAAMNYNGRLKTLEAAEADRATARIGASAFCALIVSAVFHWMTGK